VNSPSCWYEDGLARRRSTPNTSPSRSRRCCGGRHSTRQGTVSKGVSGGLKHRVGKASELINDHLGALTHVEGNGGISSRGAGCPLSALAGKHPGVCLAVETFVSEIVGVPVRECCDRDNRPRCCFEIEVEHARRST
jgi:predicted ArsR family transcriptional regulator